MLLFGACCFSARVGSDTAEGDVECGVARTPSSCVGQAAAEDGEGQGADRQGCQEGVEEEREFVSYSCLRRCLKCARICPRIVPTCSGAVLLSSQAKKLKKDAKKLQKKAKQAQKNGKFGKVCELTDWRHGNSVNWPRARWSCGCCMHGA